MGRNSRIGIRGPRPAAWRSGLARMAGLHHCAPGTPHRQSRVRPDRRARIGATRNNSRQHTPAAIVGRSGQGYASTTAPRPLHPGDCQVERTDVQTGCHIDRTRDTFARQFARTYDCSGGTVGEGQSRPRSGPQPRMAASGCKEGTKLRNLVIIARPEKSPSGTRLHRLRSSQVSTGRYSIRQTRCTVEQ